MHVRPVERRHERREAIVEIVEALEVVDDPLVRAKDAGGEWLTAGLVDLDQAPVAQRPLRRERFPCGVLQRGERERKRRIRLRRITARAHNTQAGIELHTRAHQQQIALRRVRPSRCATRSSAGGTLAAAVSAAADPNADAEASDPADAADADDARDSGVRADGGVARSGNAGVIVDWPCLRPNTRQPDPAASLASSASGGGSDARTSGDSGGACCCSRSRIAASAVVKYRVFCSCQAAEYIM